MNLFPKTCCYHFHHDVKIVITSHTRHKITRNCIMSGGGLCRILSRRRLRFSMIDAEFILLLPRPRETRKTKKSDRDLKFLWIFLDQIGRMKLSAALIGSTMAVDRPEPITEGAEPEGTKLPFKNIHIKDDMFYSPAHLNHLERQV